MESLKLHFKIERTHRTITKQTEDEPENLYNIKEKLKYNR
jgi:hypothetical protein